MSVLCFCSKCSYWLQHCCRVHSDVVVATIKVHIVVVVVVDVAVVAGDGCDAVMSVNEPSKNPPPTTTFQLLNSR